MSVFLRNYKRSHSRLALFHKYGRLSYSLFAKNKDSDHIYASPCALQLSHCGMPTGFSLNPILPLKLNVNLTRSHADSIALGLQNKTEESIENLEYKEINNKESLHFDRKLHDAERILKGGRFLNRSYLKNLIDTVNQKGYVDSSQMLFILRCCSRNASFVGPADQITFVKQIWDTFQKKDLKLDVSHFNGYLDVLLESEKNFCPMEFLKSLEGAGVTPNRVTYGRLLHRYCLAGDLEGATRILEVMKEKNIPVGESVFNSLIIGNSRANDMEGALGTIQMMKQSDLSPSGETYGALLLGYAEKGDTDAINKLLEQCREEKIEIPGNALMDALIALGKRGLDSQIDVILSLLKEQNQGYNQLIMSTICRLVHAGQHQLAQKIFFTLSVMEERDYSHSFYPILLVNSNLDVETVSQYCEEIYKKGVNLKAHDIAYEQYLLSGQHKAAFQFLKKMHQKGAYIPEHYFFPIVRFQAVAGNIEGVYGVLEEMIAQKIEPSHFFYTKFFIPSLGLDYDDMYKLIGIFFRLSTYKDSIKLHTFYTAFVQALLKKDLEIAAKFVEELRYGHLQSPLSRSLLLSAYEQSYNATAAVCVLEQMLPLYLRRGLPEAQDEREANSFDCIRIFMVQLAQSLKASDDLSRHFLPFLQEMLKRGVRISPSIASEVVEKVGPSSITDEIQSLLDQLCDPNLFPASIFEKRRRPTDDNLDLSGDGLRLYQLIMARRVEQTKELVQKMKAEEQEISLEIKVPLLNLYLDQNRLADAEQLVNEFVDNHPDYKMSAYNIAKYALALVKDGRVLDAVKALLMLSSEDGRWTNETKPPFHLNSYLSTIKEMVKIVVNMEDMNLLKLLEEAIVSRKFAKNAVFISQLIHHYAKSGNIDEGIKMLEKLVEEHNSTGGRDALLETCIEKEDTDSIQKIMDLNSRVHGDMNTLYDIAFAFLKAGKLKQAKKVFQTPGLRPIHSRLDSHCGLLVTLGNLTEIEHLIAATKPIFNLNQSFLYEHLLKVTISQNMPEKALEIWTSMQDEGIVASQQFLANLADFLHANGIKVPFSAPRTPTVARTPTVTRTPTVSYMPPKPESLGVKLERLLERQDFKGAIELWEREKQLERSGLTGATHWKIVQGLVEVGRREEAISEAKDWLKNRINLKQSLLSRYCRMLAELGDMDGLVAVKEKCEEKDLQKMHNAMLDLSYVTSGRAEERINMALEAVKENVNLDDTSNLSYAALYEIIANHYQLKPQLDLLLEAKAEKGSNNTALMLFDALSSNGHTEEAEKLYEKNLKEAKTLYVRSTCRKAIKENDVNPLKHLLEIIERHPEDRESVKGFVLSSYIQILAYKEEAEEGLQVVKDSLDSIDLASYTEGSLVALKKATLDKGLTFPYDVEALKKERELKKKRRDDTSSDSSSDEEK